MSDPFLMRPVGHVRCDRAEAIDDDWDSVPARIELDTTVFDDTALMGLDTFSHAEVIFLFDQVPDAKIVTGARHPRGRTDWPKIGIFAQRGKNGTPVIDIKPVMSGFQPRGTLREPGWSKEIMETYW